MSWIQIEIKTSAQHCDFLEELLLELEASSVTFSDAADQPIYEPDLGTTPLWTGVVIQGLFTENSDMNYVANQLKLKASGLWKDLAMTRLEDKAWEREWMNDFHPMQFSARLWVCPSWCKPPDSDAINIILDPGCGFGTGTHPTTSMCLSWLGENELLNKQVIDYGCGSGILAIGAMLLGAESAIGVDIDSQAIQASFENSKRNHIDQQKFTAVYPQNIPEVKADILLANILSGPLIQLAPTFATLIKPEGNIVLSGILSVQTDDVINAYQPWFEGFDLEYKSEWVRITAKRNLM